MTLGHYKLTSRTLVFSLALLGGGVFLFANPFAGYGFAGGSGTEGDPYQIATCQQLQNMNQDLDAHYILINDIDCSETDNWNSGAGFDPVGTMDTNPFDGTLDGQGYAINDLYINRPTEEGVGLFAGIEQSDLSNFMMTNVDITGLSFVGAVAGEFDDHDGVVENIGVESGSVTSTQTSGNRAYAGGFVGFIDQRDGGIVRDSYSRADVSSPNDGDRVAGFGSSYYMQALRIYSTGSVSSGGSSVGGLFGIGAGGSPSSDESDLIINGGSEDSVVVDSFWNTETSGQATSHGGTGKTTAEMKDIDTFTSTSTTGLNSAWDFEANPNNDSGNNDTWGIQSNFNDAYPYLSIEDPSPHISTIGQSQCGGQTCEYSTVQNWWDDVKNSENPAQWGEVYSGGGVGGWDQDTMPSATSTSDNFPRLYAADGHGHTGRIPDDVDDLARLTSEIELRVPYTYVGRMEGESGEGLFIDVADSSVFLASDSGADNTVVDGNLILNNVGVSVWSWAYYAEGVSGKRTVRNNIAYVYGSASSDVRTFYFRTGADPFEVEILNNIAVLEVTGDGTREGLQVRIDSGEEASGVIMNNFITGADDEDLDVSSSGANNIIISNNASGDTSANSGHFSGTTGLVNLDPADQFVSPSSNWFPKADADIIDAGTSTASTPNYDAAGATRPRGSAPDIGALEYILEKMKIKSNTTIKGGASF